MIQQHQSRPTVILWWAGPAADPWLQYRLLHPQNGLGDHYRRMIKVIRGCKLILNLLLVSTFRIPTLKPEAPRVEVLLFVTLFHHIHMPRNTVPNSFKSVLHLCKTKVREKKPLGSDTFLVQGLWVEAALPNSSSLRFALLAFGTVADSKPWNLHAAAQPKSQSWP